MGALIARACEENVIFMALSADQQPHFTTIASFITKMKQTGACRFYRCIALLRPDRINRQKHVRH